MKWIITWFSDGFLVSTTLHPVKQIQYSMESSTFNPNDIYLSLFCLASQQFTRDVLIKLCGAKEKGRDFVYWTEVKNIPSTDLATIERLWNKFSGGKFGYTVQKVRLIPF